MNPARTASTAVVSSRTCSSFVSLGVTDSECRRSRPEQRECMPMLRHPSQSTASPICYPPVCSSCWATCLYVCPAVLLRSKWSFARVLKLSTVVRRSTGPIPYIPNPGTSSECIRAAGVIAGPAAAPHHAAQRGPKSMKLSLPAIVFHQCWRQFIQQEITSDCF